jgi:hypothetical protein
VNEKPIPEIALGVVTPRSAQVSVTGVAVSETGTEAPEPQVAAVQAPQFFGLPDESRLTFIVAGVATEKDMLPVVAPPTAGPASPEMVNDMPVYADASMVQAAA